MKQTAPALVRRAARGERIVITRYGRPAALLSPLEPLTPSPGGRRRAWEKEREVFERLAPKVTKRMAGRYVAVCGGKVVGSDLDADRLYERIFRKLGTAVFFIGRVGTPPPVVEMPGFEIE